MTMETNDLLKKDEPLYKNEESSNNYEKKLEKFNTIIIVVSSIVSFAMLVCAIAFTYDYKYQSLVIPMFIAAVLNELVAVFIYYFVMVFIGISNNIKEINRKMK